MTEIASTDWVDPRQAVYEAENAPRRPVARTAALIAREVGAPTGESRRVMVDLGCGPGTVGAEVVQLLPDLVHIGMDWAVAPLKDGAALGMRPLRAALDPAQVPIASSSCDVVLLCEVIEHLVDTDRVLAEARRILRPDGLLVVTTPNLGAWFNRLMLLAGRQPVFTEVSTRRIYGRAGSIVVGHLRLFTTRALTEMLADSGFRDLRVTGLTYHDVPRPARWLDRLIARWSTSGAAQLVVVCRPDAG
jgi:SAM-dependent methyltransferase